MRGVDINKGNVVKRDRVGKCYMGTLVVVKDIGFAADLVVDIGGNLVVGIEVKDFFKVEVKVKVECQFVVVDEYIYSIMD